MSARFVRRTAMTALVAGLLLSACGEDVGRAADGGVDLTGSWHLVSGRDADGSFDLTGRSVTLVVEGDTASGTSACNHYSGDLEVEGDSVRLGGMSGTEMACEAAVMDLERRYLDALGVVARVERSGDALTLSGPGRRLDFELDPPVQDAPLIDTTWVLESIVDGDVVSSALPGSELRLNGNGNGNLEGFTGCGTITGRFEVAADAVAVTGLATEPRGAGPCPADEQEQHDRVVAVLRDGFTAQVEGDRLRLRSGQGWGLDLLAG